MRRPVVASSSPRSISVAERVNPRKARPPTPHGPRVLASAATSPFAAAGRRVHDSRAQQEPEHRVLRSFPPSGTHRDGSAIGNEAADRGGGGVRCGLRANGDRPRRVVRLPMADSLCDRMERGEEESPYAPPRCISAQPFLQTLRRVRLPTSGRRKFPSGNFRSARDLEGAKRVSRGQAYRQTSTRPRLPEDRTARLRHRNPSGPSPFVTGNEECPHYRSWLSLLPRRL